MFPFEYNIQSLDLGMIKPVYHNTMYKALYMCVCVCGEERVHIRVWGLSGVDSRGLSFPCNIFEITYM